MIFDIWPPNRTLNDAHWGVQKNRYSMKISQITNVVLLCASEEAKYTFMQEDNDRCSFMTQIACTFDLSIIPRFCSSNRTRKKKENKTWSKEHFSYIKKLYVNTFGMLELQLFQHALCCFIVCSTTVWQPTSRLLPSAHKGERERQINRHYEYSI